MMEESEIKNDTELKKRPGVLSVLCILTFIYSGMACFSALFTPLFSDAMIEFLKATPNFDETKMDETIQLLKAGWGYYSVIFTLSLLSLLGAIFMWRLRKFGFHIYALSNSGLLFVPTLFFGVVVNGFGIFITASFIALYAFHLKQMS